MRITLAPMVAMTIATVAHLPLCFLFVKVLDFGFPGLAIATSCKDALCAIALELYCFKSDKVKGSL